MKAWHYRAYTPELMDTINYCNPEEKMIATLDKETFFDEELQSRVEDLHAMLDSLSKIERDVIWMYYFDGLTFQEIANKKKYSRQYIHQVYQKTIAKLKKALCQ